MENQLTEKEVTKKAIRLILESGYIISDTSKRLIERHIRVLMTQPNIRKILTLPCRGYEELLSNNTVEIQMSYRQGIVKYTIAPEEIIICVAIGLAGWAAWTAADRIRDGENNLSGKNDGGNIHDLYIFSILRPIIDELIDKLSLPDVHMNHIKRIIGTMEYANAGHCVLNIREQSSSKSMGAAIPLLVLMMRVGASHKDISLCEDFFRYFILARQLSDDALDWKEDSGITNATLIVKLLEDVFEEKVKYEVAAEILKRSRQAIEKARGISCFNDTGLLEELPRYYEKMADRILKNIPER